MSAGSLSHFNMDIMNMRFLKNKPLLFFTMLYSPAILIVLQSYFKSSLTGFHHSWTIYWLTRIALIVMFVVLLFRLASDKDFNPSTIKSIDRYDHIRKQQDPLLAVRALACLNVFIGHWFINVFYPAISLPSPFNSIVRTLVSVSPWGGVWIFFTLSGYLMGKGFVTTRHTLTKSGIKKFYTHRIRRIFPIYFSVIFIVAVLMNPQTLDFRNHLMIKEFLEYTLFDLNGLRGSNGVLWSISAECQFYLLVPFLYLIIGSFFTTTKKLFLLALILAIGFSSLRYSILTCGLPWYDKVYMPLLSNLDCFLVGVITSIIVNNCRIKDFYLRKGMTYGLISVIALQIILTCWSYPAIVFFPLFNSFMSLAPAVTALITGTCILLFEISELNHKSTSPFWKISAFAGAITYCFYVWHWPIIHSLRKLFGYPMSLTYSIKILPFGFGVTLIVSYFFYKFIEKHYDNSRLKSPSKVQIAMA
jgi:peptidoglycan/LPS O-acetylase OafA/YrhL